MRRHPTAPTLAAVLLLMLLSVPATGQGIPDKIPDTPGESPADRVQERLIEQHRGFLGRVFTTGSFAAGPLANDGIAYQSSAGLGLRLRSGDAVFLTMSSWRLPAEPDQLDPAQHPWIWHVSVGYALSGTRALGWTEAGRRSALKLELGAWTGETSVVAVDVSPTYDILQGATWGLAVGPRLSLARIESQAAGIIHPFVGLTVAGRWHLFSRDRLELE